MSKIGAIAMGIRLGFVGREMAKHAADYQSYLISAQACGVSVERAKEIFEEEMPKPGGFDSWLQTAKERIYSGEEPAS